MAHPIQWKVIAMHDSNLDNIWHVEIKFVEDETHTHATVRAQLRDGETSQPTKQMTSTIPPSSLR